MIGIVLGALLGQSQIPQLPQQAYVSRSPTQPGDNLPQARAQAPSDRASVVRMQAFGQCVARRRPAQAAALLRMDFNTVEQRRALEKLAFSESDCIGRNRRAKFAGVLFAGALAEQLLSRTENLAAALAYDPAKPPVKALSESDYVASCVARTSPDKVAGLLAVPAASDAEKAALSGLAPIVQQCIRTGQQARFNRPGLRAILATASYRLVEAGRTNPRAG